VTPLGQSVLAGIVKAMVTIDAAAYEVCGFIDRAGNIYPLGSDTKVLSTAFELITRPFIYEVAKAHIPLPLSSVDVFAQEKWRVASDRAGSGNTTNLGSIEGVLDDFAKGRGPFKSEAEFLEYWRGYGRTSADRAAYGNLTQFRGRKKDN
jgi:hypothetical protein